MAHVQCTDVQDRPLEFLDVTSLPRDELQPRVPPCEAAFQAPRAAWRRDGHPRPARRCSVDNPCSLPPPEDRLLSILASVKTYSRQGVPGRLCGRGQSQANPWLPVLLPVRLAAWRPRGAAPARSLRARAPRRGVAEVAAATGGTPRDEAPGAVVVAPAPTPDAPRVPMTGRPGASSAPTPLLHSTHVRVASQGIPRSHMSCWSMPCASSSC